MGSGCGDSIVDQKILRPPGNSPSRWHLTRRLLLCSRITIHEITENVNTHFIDITGSIGFSWQRQPFSEKLSYLSYGISAVFAEFPNVFLLQWYHYS